VILEAVGHSAGLRAWVDLNRDPLVLPKASDVRIDAIERSVCCPLGQDVRLRDAITPTFPNTRAFFTATLSHPPV
jgi:hypothetical protein